MFNLKGAKAMSKEFLTIKELSQILGKSPQSFYKRINKDGDVFNDYVKKVGGKTLVSRRILEEVYQDDFKDVNQFKKVDEPVDNQIELITSLKNQVEFQKKEIDQKNEQIKELMERLKEITKTLDQQQQLAAIDKQKILELESSTENKNKGFFNRLFNK